MSGRGTTRDKVLRGIIMKAIVKAAVATVLILVAVALTSHATIGNALLLIGATPNVLQTATVVLSLVAGMYVADYTMQTQQMWEAKRDAWTTMEGTQALIAHGFHHALITGLILIVLGGHWAAAAAIVFITHLIFDSLGVIGGLFGIEINRGLNIAVLVACGILLA